jgi:hypothetical protein
MEADLNDDEILVALSGYKAQIVKPGRFSLSAKKTKKPSWKRGLKTNHMNFVTTAMRN